MNTGWVELVAGLAEIVGEIIIPIFLDRDPSSPPQLKIHPSLRPGAASLTARWQMGLGGRRR